MHFTSSIVATLGMASYASAHIMMTTPKPFGKSTLNNSPLLADGSDFPCKQRGGVYDPEGASNPMALGSTQPLNFVGSAVHGGGSCQISITYDEKPTKDSVWKVIHSIEGGCPARGVDGNLGGGPDTPVPDDYSFTIPDSLPTGNAVLAWTWFNKVGNREMYMNCAPIDITGGNSKSKRDTAAYDALPDMFTANIDNGCTTDDSKDLKFPNPGESVELLGSSTLAPPLGSCQAAGGSGGGGGSSEAPKATQSVVAAPTGIQGGVFVTVAPNASETAAPVATSAPVASVAPVASAAPAVPTNVTSNPSAPAAVVPDAGSSANNGSDTTTGSSETAAGTPCPGQEGSWNCISGTSFQRCASGQWSVVQAVAAGTTCETGISQNMKFVSAAKPRRAIRFSNEHVRRHLAYSS
ncbi:hypothetical protein V501_10120 [Pseudogymnoascus sp. VKM F-4519 (FW-2642)]|nr:hypothetical protein V501_10120 [Pseudogymnoascus sp. VKM F-4519 (FW-2642)]